MNVSDSLLDFAHTLEEYVLGHESRYAADHAVDPKGLRRATDWWWNPTAIVGKALCGRLVEVPEQLLAPERDEHRYFVSSPHSCRRCVAILAGREARKS